MQPTELLNEIRTASKRVTTLTEQAQAVAAAMVQKWVKADGATLLAGYDYTELDIDEDDISNVMNTMSSGMPDILGAHGTNLYVVGD